MIFILITASIIYFPIINSGEPASLNSSKNQQAEQAGSLRICPRNWKEYKELKFNKTKCFKPFYEMVGRDEAQRRCQQMGIGFDLIEIHSMNEHDTIVKALAESVFMLNDFNDDMFNNFRPQVWIGAKRVPFGGIKDFQYRSGCGIKDFNFWHKGQPNDHFNNEDCVHMMLDNIFMGMWADYNCNAKMYYICQFVNDLRPPCNQTNYNLFGYNETNSAIHKSHGLYIKPNSTTNKEPKRNTSHTSVDRHGSSPNRPIFPNPFEFISRLIDRFRTVLKFQ